MYDIASVDESSVHRAHVGINRYILPRVLIIILHFDHSYLLLLEAVCQMESPLSEERQQQVGCLAVVMSVIYLKAHAQNSGGGTRPLEDSDTFRETEIVEKAFKKALQIQSSDNPEVQIYYANFLIQHGSNKEALPYLKALTSSDKSHSMSDYFYIMSCTLDRLLQHVICVVMGFSIHDRILAHYYLTTILSRTDPSRVVEQLRLFEADCEEFVTRGTPYFDHSYLLLGFTYLAVGDADNAVRVLQQEEVLRTIIPRTDAQTLVEQYMAL